MSAADHQHHHLETLTAGLSPEEVQRILAAGRRVDGRAGQAIFQSGDPAVNMFLVVHGLLKVFFHGDDADHPSRYLRPGDHFGATSLLVAGPQLMTVQAVTDVVLIAIAKADFDRLILTIPAFAANLCRSLAEWFVRKIDRPQALAYPRAVALLRTAPRTHGLALQVVGAVAGAGERKLVLTDRAAAWSVAGCEVRSAVVRPDARSQFDEFLTPVIAALGAGARVFLDLPADTVPAECLRNCDEVWLLADTAAPPSPIVDRLLTAAPWLADRLCLTWLVPADEPLPAAPVPDPALKTPPRRVSVTDAGARPRCLARLTHRLQGIHLGLALGGGGALGAAHIGVIRALDRAGIYFDRVAGTSIGSVVGAGYAAGFSADQIGRFFLEDLCPPRFLRYLPKGNLWYMMAHFRLGWFESKLRRRLHQYTFDQLLLPLHTLSADLQSGAEVVREEGDVVRAVLESINLPFVAAPIRRDDQVLVDGGVLNNVPADVLRARHANFIVASHLLTELNPEVGGQLWQLLFRILEVQMRRLVLARNPAIDVTITPRLAAFRFEDFSQSAALIEAGEEAGEAMVPEILRKVAALCAP